MQHFQLPHEKAVQLIERRDYEIDAYLRHNYGSDGHQPNLYHLLINTSLFSFELSAQLMTRSPSPAKTIG